MVDWFTKHAHFFPLPTSFNASKVAEILIVTVVKYHWIPKTVVSDRDPIFVSKFWKQLFEASGTKLKHSTTYHPQTDGQTEFLLTVGLNNIYEQWCLSDLIIGSDCCHGPNIVTIQVFIVA